ncbi:MAG: helix-turn-helix transcriptional regulator [Atopobium sp.]|nr:helix-turn-helix transcriptional regulator [Atopobium sp.]
MSSSQALLSDAVQRFLKDTNTPQTALADDLGITQATLSRKLNGVRNWNLKDVDQLMRIGVPVGFGTLAAALTEEGEDA